MALFQASCRLKGLKHRLIWELAFPTIAGCISEADPDCLFASLSL